MKYPNLFIVGTPKAGTTSIHDNLARVSGVYMSRVKEPHYFSDIGGNVPSVVSLSSKQYHALFDDVSNEIVIGESSVSYLHDPDTPYKIKKVSPDAQIVIMLRNPVHRLYSHWLMDYREGVTSLPFRKAVEKDRESPIKGFGKSHMYMECSMYSGCITRYMEVFGRERVFVGFFEDYIEDGDKFMGRLVDWLGCPGGWVELELSKSNPAGEVKNGFIALLFHNFYLRRLLKKYLPVALKSKIRSSILKPAEKSKIDQDDYEYYKSCFEKDVRKLSTIVDWDYQRWGYE